MARLTYNLVLSSQGTHRVECDGVSVKGEMLFFWDDDGVVICGVPIRDVVAFALNTDDDTDDDEKTDG